MELEKLKIIIKEKRHTGADYHAHVGRAWRLLGNPNKLHASLAYAAFEFRIAMERSLLELLYLIKKHRLTEKELKYDFGKVVKALYKTQSGSGDGKERLRRRIKFNSIYCKNMPDPYRPPKDIADIDIDKINNFWSSLSQYCHRQLTEKTSWSNKEWLIVGYDILKKVEDYIWEIMVKSSVGWIELCSLPTQIEEQAISYIEGVIDESRLENRLKIILPVLEEKEKLKRIILTI